MPLSRVHRARRCSARIHTHPRGVLAAGPAAPINPETSPATWRGVNLPALLGVTCHFSTGRLSQVFVQLLLLPRGWHDSWIFTVCWPNCRVREGGRMLMRSLGSVFSLH